MKIWQAVLLAGMALMDCLVVVVGLIIVLGSAFPSPSGVASSNPTATPALPQATVPIGPTLSPTPSETPLTMVFQFPSYTPYGTPAETPTLTPSPTDKMAGWMKFFVKEVEMWMPETYAAGNPHTEGEAIIATLKEKGANFNWDLISEQMASIDDAYIFWGIDSHQGNPDIVTFLEIAYDVPNSGEPLPEYTTRFVGAISEDFNMVEQKKFSHKLYEAQRVILDMKNTTGTPVRVVMYAMLDRGIVWDVFCFTAVDEMSVRLPTFDQMIGTFQVLALPG